MDYSVVINFCAVEKTLFYIVNFISGYQGRLTALQKHRGTSAPWNAWPSFFVFHKKSQLHRTFLPQGLRKLQQKAESGKDPQAAQKVKNVRETQPAIYTSWEPSHLHVRPLPV